MLGKKAVDHTTALYFAGQREVTVRKEALLELQKTQVLVQTQFSTVSHGTECPIYRGEFPEGMTIVLGIADLSSEFAYPFRYGYAAVGLVVALGEDVEARWEGSLVTALHPHESYFVANPSALFQVPADIGAEDAAFLPMETAVNLVMDGAPVIGEGAVIFGQGIVGLLTTSTMTRCLRI
jgi:threonine dehydrogenase-like Zn-dependent dehydrogenase